MRHPKQHPMIIFSKDKLWNNIFQGISDSWWKWFSPSHYIRISKEVNPVGCCHWCNLGMFINAVTCDGPDTYREWFENGKLCDLASAWFSIFWDWNLHTSQILREKHRYDEWPWKQKKLPLQNRMCLNNTKGSSTTIGTVCLIKQYSGYA